MVRIGIKRTDITPPVGIPLIGFAGRGPAIGIHDPLTATALVASDDTQTIAIVACDLLYMSAELVAMAREEISRRLDIPPQHVAIACSHTHYGPKLDPDDEREDVSAYVATLKFDLAGIVQEAHEAQQPARMGVGWGSSDIGINRRERLPDGRIILGHNPGGAIDRSVGVCRISGAGGEPLGTIVNFSTHPVSQGGQMRLVSSDYPGSMRRVVEHLTGAPCLFLQGACGNINAFRMEHSYEPARTLGTRLGCEVARVWETITPKQVDSVASAAKTVDLPRYRFDSREQADYLAGELEAAIERLRAEDPASGSLYWAETRLRRVKAAQESWASGQPLEPVPAEFQAYRLGDLALATAPSETFCQIGQEIKSNSPHQDTFFVGYTNGAIGYMPVPEAYPEGGYEVTHACNVDPGASRIAIDTCGELLEAVKADER